MWKSKKSNFMRRLTNSYYCREVFYEWQGKSKYITTKFREVNIYQNHAGIFVIDIYAPINFLQTFFNNLIQSNFMDVQLEVEGDYEARITFSGQEGGAIQFIRHASNYDVSLKIENVDAKMIAEIDEVSTVTAESDAHPHYLGVKKAISKPKKLNLNHHVNSLIMHSFNKGSNNYKETNSFNHIADNSSNLTTRSPVIQRNSAS